MPFDPEVHVGTAAWIERDNKLLLMKRGESCSHGAGQWALPGGWVDFGEDPVESVCREVREELGIVPLGADLMMVVAITWAPGHGPGHVVCVTYKVRVADDADPKIMEADKCDALSWVPLDDLSYADRSMMFPDTDAVLERANIYPHYERD